MRHNVLVELTNRPDEDHNECENCCSYSNIKITLNGYSEPEEVFICTECANRLIAQLSNMLANKELIESKNDIYRGIP